MNFTQDITIFKVSYEFYLFQSIFFAFIAKFEYFLQMIFKDSKQVVRSYKL